MLFTYIYMYMLFFPCTKIKQQGTKFVFTESVEIRGFLEQKSIRIPVKQSQINEN